MTKNPISGTKIGLKYIRHNARLTKLYGRFDCVGEAVGAVVADVVLYGDVLVVVHEALAHQYGVIG